MAHGAEITRNSGSSASSSLSRWGTFGGTEQPWRGSSLSALPPTSSVARLDSNEKELRGLSVVMANLVLPRRHALLNDAQPGSLQQMPAFAAFTPEVVLRVLAAGDVRHLLFLISGLMCS